MVIFDLSYGYPTIQKGLDILLYFFRQVCNQRVMRNIINKLIKKHSTSAERKFSELLKELHIPFRYKVKIKGKEVDFVIGKYAIEIDGHTQDVNKNKMLLSEGYTTIHINNNEVSESYVKEWLKQIK